MDKNNKYYFQLVCVDEEHALAGYRVLNQEWIGNLEDVHDYVEKHLNDHSPEHTKWILLPYRKDEVNVC